MSHVDNKQPKLGFTLIELMLAMTFISILLIAIAVTIIQVSNIYNHGITLKEVNQAGRNISEDLQRTMRSGSQFDISVDSTRYLQQDDWGGRLCLGNYSYIWNYGKAININNPDGPSLNVYTSNIGNPIRFLKIVDGSFEYCSNPSKAIDPLGATDLLDVGDHNLALHGFVVTSGDNAGDNKTGERLYSVRFTIGTNDLDALNYSDNSVDCKPPGTAGSDPSYCSVQEFNIVIRVGNAVK